jgi:phosphatidylglycerophosphate synthase
MSTMTSHVRVNQSFLASSEKRLLVHIAARLPGWINSDHLTLLALGAMAFAGLGFALARVETAALWLVVLALALNWFGDSLDGTLARVRRAERPRYGFYVDHVLDIVGITMLMAGLAVSGFMTPVVALAVLVAYLLVSGEVFLATAVNGVFRMAFLGFGPTELRIVLAIGTIALFGNPHVDLGAAGRYRLFDVGGAIAAIGMGVGLAVAVVRNTRTLARLEPRPTGNQESGMKN